MVNERNWRWWQGEMGKGPILIDALRIGGMTMASNVLGAKLNFGLDFRKELYKDTSRVRASPNFASQIASIFYSPSSNHEVLPTRSRHASDKLHRSTRRKLTRRPRIPSRRRGRQIKRPRIRSRRLRHRSRGSKG